MIQTLSFKNYRSLLDIRIPLKRINVVTGDNGCGKSNLYKALRLLSDVAQGRIVQALANEGGLNSVFFAGPENISRQLKEELGPLQGVITKGPKRLWLGFGMDDFGYAIGLGLPSIDPHMTLFIWDAEIKKEAIWHGPKFNPRGCLMDRSGPLVRVRSEKGWNSVLEGIQTFDSALSQIGDPNLAPEVFYLRDVIRTWRFYDQFRTDANAPARVPWIASRTPVLHHDGRDLASALQTILEIGDETQVEEAIQHAFPGSILRIQPTSSELLEVLLEQPGMLRPLSARELSDGTLRYLLWIAALLTPRPPRLMVLNEPENSLHPQLLPALANLIIQASQSTQLWIVTHSKELAQHLQQSSECKTLELKKKLGVTYIEGMELEDYSQWSWPNG